MSAQPETIQSLVQEIAALRQQIQQLEQQLSSGSKPGFILPKQLLWLSTRMCQTPSEGDFFREAVQSLRLVLKADRVVIYRFHPDYSGEFVAESVGRDWIPLTHLQHQQPEILQNISSCTIQHVQSLSQTLTAMTLEESFQQDICRVCADIETADFAANYLAMLRRYQARAYAIAPIYDEGRLWGLVAAYQNATPRQWENQDISCLLQVAVYLEAFLKRGHLQAMVESNNQQYTAALTQQIQRQKIQIQQEQRKQHALAEVIDNIRNSLDLDLIFSAAVRETRRLLMADRVGIYQFQPETNCEYGQFVAEDVQQGLPSALAIAVHDRCFAEHYQTDYLQGHILRIDDVAIAEISECHRDILTRFHIHANLVVPIIQHQTLWGLLCIHQCYQARHWQTHEVQFVQKIAVQLAVALQQAELLSHAHQRTQELQAALQQVKHQKTQQSRIAQQEKAIALIIERIRRTLDLETTLQVTTQEILSLLNCDRAAVYQFNEDWSGEYICEACGEGWDPLIVANIRTVWRDDYLQETRGGRYANRETFAVNDIYTAGHEDCHVELLEMFQIRAYVIVPIFVGADLWGLLAAYQNSGTRDWQAWEVDLLKRLGDQLGVAVQQNQLIEQLRQASAEADAANRAKSLFLANMSHELRTPLNAILGFTQVLRRHHNLDQTQAEHLDIINRAGNHLLSLLNDVLEMSKIEAGRVQLNEAVFDFQHMLRTLVDMFSLRAAQKGLALEAHIAPEMPRCLYTDQSKLQQVLINLLSNALKFTEAGFIRLEVSLEQGETPPGSEEPLGLLQCKVIDTGCGIAVQELDELFNPFVQTASGRRSHEGTGLGLSISKKFVHLMGGEFHVTSEVGMGSCFRFSAKVVIPKEQTCGMTDFQVQAIAADQPAYRLLVVDDQDDSRMALSYLLNSVGFQVKEASDGAAAIQILQTWEPDFIWMDMEMPGMNGYEAIERIRTDLQNTAVKIVALTASAFDHQRDMILALGCDDFVRKPYINDEIFQTLSKHLGVQYTYQGIIQPKQSTITAQTSLEVEVLQAQLQQMRNEWISQLRQAAIAARESQINNLIQEITDAYPELSCYLQKLLQQLAFDQIVHFVET